MKAKQRDILSAATTLFESGGFHATGVDAIAEAAAVSKRTLYKYFPTKEMLVRAVMKHYVDTGMSGLQALAQDETRTPQDRILHLFDLKELDFTHPAYSGCLASNAYVEYADKGAEKEEIAPFCQAFKLEFERVLLTLCTQSSRKKAPELARKITLVMEGAMAYAALHKTPQAARDAKEIVQQLLEC